MARNEKRPPGDGPEIDARLIRDLAKLLEETGLSEIEVETGGKRVKVARQLSAMVAPAPAPQSPLKSIVAPAPEPASEAGDLAKHPGAVTSPMVGTAYLAPDPNSPVFVKLGDTVSAGQTLLIIDAMKTMNPIAAPRAGKVAQILISNGVPVEYGQALMIVE